MFGQRLSPMKQQVGRLIEWDLASAWQTERFGLADSFDASGDRVDIDAFRCFALEPEQDRLVGSVSFARERERAVEMNLDAPGRIEQTRFGQPIKKLPRSTHRPDGVRATRSDADGEKIEDADLRSHGRLVDRKPEASLEFSPIPSIDEQLGSRTGDSALAPAW